MRQQYDQPGSITNLRFRRTASAREKLVRTYWPKVRCWAKSPLRNTVVVDCSDVALSVFRALFVGMNQRRYHWNDRDDLERLLRKITRCVAINKHNWEKAPKRHPCEKLSDDEILDLYPPPGPYRQVAELHYRQNKTADQIAFVLRLDSEVVQRRLAYMRGWMKRHRYQPRQRVSLEERHEHFLIKEHLTFEEAKSLLETLLPHHDILRDTALLRLKGLDNHQIAAIMDVSVRQVQRRFRVLWSLLLKRANTGGL